jgi:hypothetical protein
MNINTKQITAIAVLSFFAYAANAQTATFTGDSFGTENVEGLRITPEGDAAPANFVTDNTSNQVITDNEQTDVGTDRVITNLNKAGTATASATTSTVGQGGQGPHSVSISNNGININTVTSSTNTASLDRYTQSVQTVDLDINSPTFTESVTVYTSWATAANAGADGTRIFEDDGTATSLADALQQVDDQITVINANDSNVAAALEVDDDPTTTGGTLNVGGNLRVGAIGDVEASIGANAGAITTLNGDATVVGSVANSIDALATGAVAGNTGAIAGNTGAIAGNTGAITTLNGDDTVVGSVANSIAVANADSGISSNGIAGVVEKQTNAAGDEIIQLGSNTFSFNNTTDTISTSSGVINLAADVAITGDLEVAGDVFVGGRSQGVQSQIDNNREDIDRNARGIAMVAALQHTTVLPGMTQALDLSAAHFEGETGLAINYSRRINDNVQINFGAASTSDFDESVVKAGIGWQW